MAKKRTSGKGKESTPLVIFVIFLLILLGVWIYFQQKAPFKPKAAADKGITEEKRVRELMQENPDAEIFKDAESESKKKSPVNSPQPSESNPQP